MELRPETQELYLWHCQEPNQQVGERRDPDFALHEDVLINNDRFRPVDTPTTRAKAVEIERLHVFIATQSRQRGLLAPAYREETFLSLVEWAQSQDHRWNMSSMCCFIGESLTMVVSCLQLYLQEDSPNAYVVMNDIYPSTANNSAVML